MSQSKLRTQSMDFAVQIVKVLKKNKKALTIILAVLGAAVVIAAALFFGIPFVKYCQTVKMMDNGQYAQALAAFDNMDDYLKSKEHGTECRYLLAQKIFGEGKYQESLDRFIALGEYKDSQNMVLECRYIIALQQKDAGNYSEAAESFAALGEYKDGARLTLECRYLQACAAMAAQDYQGALDVFIALQDYKDSMERVLECKYQIAIIMISEGKLEDVCDQLEALGEFKDSKALLDSVKKALQRIQMKPRLFVNGSWNNTDGARVWVNTAVIDQNTLKIEIMGSNGADDQEFEDLKGVWDETTGTVKFVGRKYRTIMGNTYCENDNLTGYIYYENGRLCVMYGNGYSGGQFYR